MNHDKGISLNHWTKLALSWFVHGGIQTTCHSQDASDFAISLGTHVCVCAVVIPQTHSRMPRKRDPFRSGSAGSGRSAGSGPANILFFIWLVVIPCLVSRGVLPRKGYRPQISSWEQMPPDQMSALFPP